MGRKRAGSLEDQRNELPDGVSIVVLTLRASRGTSKYYPACVLANDRRSACAISLSFAAILRTFQIFFFFQAEDGIRDLTVTGVQTCALPISQVAGRVQGLHR